MIRELVQAGFRLSGHRDPRLMRGLRWAAVEGVFAAAPYLLLYGLLQDVFVDPVSSLRALGYGTAMWFCASLLDNAACR